MADNCLDIQFFKVTELPLIGEPDSVYWLLQGGAVKQYVTDKQGTFLSSPGFAETLTALNKVGSNITYLDETGNTKIISFANVAFSGSYTDLINKIANTSELNNDGNGVSPFATVAQIPTGIGDLDLNVPIGTSIAFDATFAYVLNLLDQDLNVMSQVEITTANIKNLSSYLGFDFRYYTKAEISDFISGTTPITGYNKSNWDLAFSWGNHATQGYLTSFSEDDPIFTGSPAGTITASNITNWNLAFGWGDHAAAGYLTSYTETDPVFTASVAASITAPDISDWDLAFTNRVTTIGFNTTNGDLTGTRPGATNLITSLDGRYSLIGHIHAIADITGLQSTLDSISTFINTTVPNTYLPFTGGTLTGALIVPDEIYGISWDSSLEVPTKNSIYDKIETLSTIGHTHVIADITDFTDNSTNWNTAFSWGDHAGLYLGLTAKAADSELLDGLDSLDFLQNVATAYAGDLDNLSVNGKYKLTTGVTNFPPTASLIGSQVVNYIWDTNAIKQIFYEYNTDRIFQRRKVTTWQPWVELGAGGGAATLVDLTDTTITSPVAFDFLRHDGTDWKNVNIDNLGAGNAGASYDIVDLNTIVTVGQSAMFRNAGAGSTNTPDGINDGYVFQMAQGDVTSRGAQIAVRRAGGYKFFYRADNGAWDSAVNTSGDTMTGNLTTFNGTGLTSITARRTASGNNYDSYITVNGGNGGAIWGWINGVGTDTFLEQSASGLRFYSGVAYNLVWTDGNDGAGSGLDADTLRTFAPSSSSTGSTIALRDSAGDIHVRLLRSEYSPTNSTVNYIMTQIDQAGNNYVRPTTPAQFRSFVTDASYVAKSGDTMTGALTMSGAAIRRNQHNTGYLEGSYNNVGVNGAQSNPIYVIGSSYVPATTTLGDMFGIGYTDANLASFLNTTDLGVNPSGWGMYVASDGNARIFLNGSNGHGYFRGNIYAEAGVYRGNITANSDRRLKTNIKPIENALEKIHQLNGCTWDRTDMKLSQAGFIAQDMQKVLPVSVSKADDEMGTLSVDQGNAMTALLLQAVKELTKKVEQLEKQLNGKS